jgi:hypothetical protein
LPPISLNLSMKTPSFKWQGRYSFFYGLLRGTLLHPLAACSSKLFISFCTTIWSHHPKLCPLAWHRTNLIPLQCVTALHSFWTRVFCFSPHTIVFFHAESEMSATMIHMPLFLGKPCHVHPYLTHSSWSRSLPKCDTQNQAEYSRCGWRLENSCSH